MKQFILFSACVAATLCASAQERCVNTVVNLTGDQMTLTTSGAKITTQQQNFIYYERGRHRKHEETFSLPGVAADNPSKPLLLSTRQDVAAVPEKYNVSVTTPQNNLTACNDSESHLATMLNMERVAAYTGNYPDTKTEAHYNRVSKHHYKMAARKLRKIEHKEEQIARRSHVNVGVESTKA